MNKIQLIISTGFALIMTAGCSLATLDGSGRIEAGTRNECPPGQVSRFGRCCPEESSLTVCPVEATVPRYRNGELACDEQGRCPNAHGYECRQGRVCCPSGTDGMGPCHPYAMGQPCSGAMVGQCQVPSGFVTDLSLNSPRAGGRCLARIRFGLDSMVASAVVTVPGGYCSSSCRAVRSACGDDGVCIEIGAAARYDGDPVMLNNDLLCLARCRVPVGHDENTPYPSCRTESGGGPSAFRCFPVSPGDRNSTEGYCFPDCTILDYCTPASSPLFRVICSPTTHTCAPGR